MWYVLFQVLVLVQKSVPYSYQNANVCPGWIHVYIMAALRSYYKFPNFFKPASYRHITLLGNFELKIYFP